MTETMRASEAPIVLPDFGELRSLIGSFETSLRAKGRSPRTVRSYVDTAKGFVDFLEGAGMPTRAERITREHVEAYIVDQLGRFSPNTAAIRYRSLQQLFKWLDEEGEIKASPMARMHPPNVPEVPVPVVDDAALTKLLKTCNGKAFEDRRDMAILRLFIDTGCRLAEVAGLSTADVDLSDHYVVHVVGKGSRPRAVPFGPRTTQALDRYIRARARHPHAAAHAFWLGPRGAMTDSGIAQVVRRRAREAGIGKLHPHQLRHTAASAWLASGGSETDALRLFGWKSRQMLARYGASVADDRARESFRRLLPGERV